MRGHSALALLSLAVLGPAILSPPLPPDPRTSSTVPPSPTALMGLAREQEALSRATFARLPLAFVENCGQWEGPARFVPRRGGMTAYLAADSLALQLVRRAREGEESSRPEASSPLGDREGGGGPVRGVNLRLVFEGANETVRL